MKIFQNHYSNEGESKGYSYHRKRKAAAAAAADLAKSRGAGDVTTKVLDFPANRRGLMAALEHCGTHPDNG